MLCETGCVKLSETDEKFRRSLMIAFATQHVSQQDSVELNGLQLSSARPSFQSVFFLYLPFYDKKKILTNLIFHISSFKFISK